MTFRYTACRFSCGASRRAQPFLLLAALCLQSPPAHADLGLWSDLALGRFIKAEQTAEKNIASGKDETATNLAPLCLARSRLKRYNTLFACIDKLEQRIAVGDNAISGMFIPKSDIRPLPDMLRGMAWLELNKIRAAADTAERALAAVDDNAGSTWGPLPPKGYRVELLTLLGIAYALLGEEEKARHNLEILAGLDISDTQPQKYENIRSVGLARIHMALGEYELALKRMEHEHEQWVRGLSDLVIGAGDDSVNTIFNLPKLLIIGKAQASLGRNREAMHSLDSLIAHPRIVDQGDIHWIALFERGRLSERLGNRDEAGKFYLRSIDVFERQRASLTTEASKIGFVGDKQAVYARLINVLIAQGRADEAFDYVERSKSRALVDMLASKKDFTAQDPEQAQLALAQLDAADLTAQATDGGADGQPAGMRNLQVAREALQSAMPELSSLVSVTSVPSTEVSALMDADETLIEYYYNGDDLFAFVLGHTGISVTRLNGAGLDSQVRALRAAIEQPGTAAWQAESRALYEKLWKPVEAAIPTRNVIIVAHGVLHYLPFGALQANDGTLLIDRTSIRTLPSASVLKFLRPTPAGNESRLLVLGNPDLGDARLDLNFAEDEARLVADMDSTSRLLVRLDASETNLKNSAAAFSRLHFATHGKFNADAPLSSGLHLARDAINDGILTVGELYSMNLDADLVTLSACETGLGKVTNGDDVVGLTRGFLYAGSRSIVASLWSIDDRATADLMKSFYANLASETKQEALRLAQLKTREAFPHPFYWAAFQLTGRAD